MTNEKYKMWRKTPANVEQQTFWKENQTTEIFRMYFFDLMRELFSNANGMLEE